MQSLLTEIKAGWARRRARCRRSSKRCARARTSWPTDLKDVRRQLAARVTMPGPRTARCACRDDCARHLAQHVHRALRAQRQAGCALLGAGAARRADGLRAGHAGPEHRTALTTSDIPLPVQYSGEIRELISEFGVVRRCMISVSDRHGDGAAGADGHAAGVRLDRDVGGVRGEVADGDASPRWSRTRSAASCGCRARSTSRASCRWGSSWRATARWSSPGRRTPGASWRMATAPYESVKGVVQIARDNSKTLALASHEDQAERRDAG